MANTRIADAARQLRDGIDRAHAARVGQTLGCTVTILRREPLKSTSGKFTGISEPVFAMPAEFLEQAQALGLLAEARHDATN